MHLKNENNVCCFKWHSKFNMKRKTRSRRLFNKQLGHYQTKASSPRVYSNHAGILVKYSTLWFMPHPHTRLWIKSLNHRPKQKNTCQLYYVYVIIVISRLYSRFIVIQDFQSRSKSGVNRVNKYCALQTPIPNQKINK